MNTTAQALIFAVVTVASAASIGMGLADRAAAAKTEVVKLETVVIYGHRAAPEASQQVAAVRIEKLPRVVIEGRSSRAGGTQLASAAQVKQGLTL